MSAGRTRNLNVLKTLGLVLVGGFVGLAVAYAVREATRAYQRRYRLDQLVRELDGAGTFDDSADDIS